MKTLNQKLKMSLSLTILVFAATTTLLTNIQSVKAQPNRIFFEPSTPTAEVGQKFNMTVMVEVIDLSTIGVSISWNPNFINCTRIVKGTFFDPSPLFMEGVIDNTAGTARGYAWTCLEEGKSGTGSILIVEFEVLQIGGSPVEFIVGPLDTGMIDKNGDDMSFTAEDGYATLVKTLTHHIVWTDPDTGQIHEFNITTVSNSTVGSVNFNQPDMSINFTVEGASDTAGFCNVTIPRNILDCPGDIENWMILLNTTDISGNCIKTRDDYYTYIHIPYTHSTNTIKIKGTWVIPEFQTALIITLLTMAIIAITITLIYHKQNQ